MSESHVHKWKTMSMNDLAVCYSSWIFEKPVTIYRMEMLKFLIDTSTLKLVCGVSISELASFVLWDAELLFPCGFAFVSFPDQDVFVAFI